MSDIIIIIISAVAVVCLQKPGGLSRLETYSLAIHTNLSKLVGPNPRKCSEMTGQWRQVDICALTKSIDEITKFVLKVPTPCKHSRELIKPTKEITASVEVPYSKQPPPIIKYCLPAFVN